MTEAVVAGHICLDIIPTLETEKESLAALLRPGSLVDTGPAVISTGGAVSNTGIALHRLGVPTTLMGKVGEDLFGGGILDCLRAVDPVLAEGMVVAPGEASSYTVIVSAPGHDRVFLHCPGANHTFRADDVILETVAGAKLFHFGYPPLMRTMYDGMGMEARGMFERVKETGATTSLDMALPDPSSEAGEVNWMMWLGMVLPFVDIFMPSVEEILFMLDRGRFDEMMEQAPDGDILPLVTPELLDELAVSLLNMGCGVVALKVGAHGLYLRTTTVRPRWASMGKAAPTDGEAWWAREILAPCFQVEVAGTTGSGDCTIAGFLAAFLRGESPEAAVEAAVAVGACNVEAPDATSGVRPWSEVRARLDGGWARREAALPLDGFTETDGLWFGPHERKEA